MNRMLDTGLHPVWSSKFTTASLFIPLTGPLNSTEYKEVNVGLNVMAASPYAQWRQAYQTSDDGVSWNGTVTGLLSSATTTQGWVYSGATTLSTDPRPFVRFGVQVSNVSGADVQRALAQLRVQSTDVAAFTVVGGPRDVWSDGSATPIFHAMTRPMPITDDIVKIRASVEVDAESGEVGLIPAYQISSDLETWVAGATTAVEATDSFASFGATVSADGLSYATTFSDFAPVITKQYVRFGVAVWNTAGSKVETCLASIRVDGRNS